MITALRPHDERTCERLGREETEGARLDPQTADDALRAEHLEPIGSDVAGVCDYTGAPRWRGGVAGAAARRGSPQMMYHSGEFPL